MNCHHCHGKRKTAGSNLCSQCQSRVVYTFPGRAPKVTPIYTCPQPTRILRLSPPEEIGFLPAPAPASPPLPRQAQFGFDFLPAPAPASPPPPRQAQFGFDFLPAPAPASPPPPEKMEVDYDWPAMAAAVRTRGVIREVEMVDVLARHDRCMYSSQALCVDPRYVTTCGKAATDKVNVCQKHAKHEGAARNNVCPDDPDSYFLRPFPTKTKGGYFHFTRLGLFAHLTHRGFIVVGKLWHDMYAETLAGCDVKADVDYGSHINLKRMHFKNERMDNTDLVALCQSYGLLYKVLPQKYLQYPYDIANLDSLPGEGFISFEQMLRDQPELYIRYWKIWNGHIIRMQEWLRKKNDSPLKIYRDTGVRAWINWEEVEKKASLYGANHVIVSPPTLEQVKARDFNPFDYCEQWVKTYRPDQLSLDYFPPMYLLYPADTNGWKARFEADVKSIIKANRLLVQSYHYFADNPLAMMQWVKFGDPNLFHVSRSDIPPRLRSLFKADTWKDTI